jgi:hypothetical protein
VCEDLDLHGGPDDKEWYYSTYENTTTTANATDNQASTSQQSHHQQGDLSTPTTVSLVILGPSQLCPEPHTSYQALHTEHGCSTSPSCFPLQRPALPPHRRPASPSRRTVYPLTRCSASPLSRCPVSPPPCLCAQFPLRRLVSPTHHCSKSLHCCSRLPQYRCPTSPHSRCPGSSDCRSASPCRSRALDHPRQSPIYTPLFNASAVEMSTTHVEPAINTSSTTCAIDGEAIVSATAPSTMSPQTATDPIQAPTHRNVTRLIDILMLFRD